MQAAVQAMASASAPSRPQSARPSRKHAAGPIVASST